MPVTSEMTCPPKRVRSGPKGGPLAPASNQSPRQATVPTGVCVTRHATRHAHPLPLTQPLIRVRAAGTSSEPRARTQCSIRGGARRSARSCRAGPTSRGRRRAAPSFDWLGGEREVGRDEEDERGDGEDEHPHHEQQQRRRREEDGGVRGDDDDRLRSV
eukprot:5343931-Prymnesium_polylepis.2